MARKRTIAAAALNIKLHPHSADLYRKLISNLYSRRFIVKTRGETHVAITELDDIDYKSDFVSGIISKFSRIDPNADWFDIENFEPVSEDDAPVIDKNLYPNYKPFFFLFNVKKHIFVFEQYGEYGTLGHNTALKFFQIASKNPGLQKEFNVLDVDLVKDTSTLKRLLDYARLKRLKIELRRPNPDFLDEETRQDIVERMESEHARKDTRIIEAMPGESLDPTDETLAEAEMAIDNGEVVAFGQNEQGTSETRSSMQFPHEEKERYDPDLRSDNQAFRTVASRFFENDE